jgi:hypothetical protein
MIKATYDAHFDLLREKNREIATLQARNKELEAECVAAKDYMVKCGEQSSLDAKRIAQLEAVARGCRMVPARMFILQMDGMVIMGNTAGTEHCEWDCPNRG